MTYQVPAPNAGKKSGENLLPPIRQTKNPCLTGQTSRRLRTANGTPPQTWSDDDSTPLSRKTKGAGKKTRTQNQDEEAVEALSQHLKGKAQLAQYNLQLATLTEYRNLHILNLKGPPNTNDHSVYLSSVRDVSWSYPAKGNLITACQYYQDLKASKDREAIEAGDNILREKGMMGIPQESAKTRPIKCRYVIYVLRSVEGLIIDARDSDYRRDWNIGLYDIVSPASTRKVEKSSSLIHRQGRSG